MVSLVPFLSPPFNLLHSVYRICCGDAQGSAFTMTLDGRQYLVTANHVVESLLDGGVIEIAHQDALVPVRVSRVHRFADDVDLAMLTLDRELFAAPDVLYRPGGFVLGQEVGFLGFPFGLAMYGLEASKGWPIPLLKKGHIAGSGKTKSGAPYFYVDGHNNPGFSGGPAFYLDVKAEKCVIFGVVTHSYLENARVTQDRKPLGYRVETNAGIGICHSIKHMLETSARP